MDFMLEARLTKTKIFCFFIGGKLIDHLEVPNGVDYLFVGKSILLAFFGITSSDDFDVPKAHLFFFKIPIPRKKDPENTIYDALDLNRGLKETLFSISTPFAILDRLTKPDGMKDLGKVLGKWGRGKCILTNTMILFSSGPLTHLTGFSFMNRNNNNVNNNTRLAFFIPPKSEQAFLQGGTFIFDGPKTVFAHYDESTAAHADLEEVLEVVYATVKKEKATTR